MFTSGQQAQLAHAVSQWGLRLDSAQLEKFARLADLLEAGNRRLNLTRVAPEEYGALHFLDSLAFAAVFEPRPGAGLIDVGTGGGFPGVPLAIAYPELSVCLLDGTRKRLDFLDEVITDLGLANAHTLHGRAEEIARLPKHRTAYDYAVARAVAKLPELAGWLLPLVRSGGAAVAYKSRDMEAEVEQARPAIEKQGGRIERLAEIALPQTDIVRTLVVIRSSAPGPPRRREPARRK